ncbi:MAG: crossover junction endodeoxyribonuclease RuvC [Candidatus Zixiibacteriota bacterium]
MNELNENPAALIVLGIDPGLINTGYGVISHTEGHTTLLEAGVVSASPKDELASRLNEIYAGLGSVIKEFEPDLMAVEDLYSHYGHPKTAIIMGHARAMVFLQSAHSGVPIETYASTKVKSSLTGNGRASKEQVQLMVKSALDLERVPSPADAADALAVALCHLHMTRQLTPILARR